MWNQFVYLRSWCFFRGFLSRHHALVAFHLLECALCAQLTPGHVYLVVHAMVTAIAVLPLPVLLSETVCHCSFENRIFRLTVLKLYWRRFCFRWRGLLRLLVKSAVCKYTCLYFTYLLRLVGSGSDMHWLSGRARTAASTSMACKKRMENTQKTYARATLL